MIKYSCDGCDSDIYSYAATKNQVIVDITQGVDSRLSKTFELCESCSKSLIRQADPTTWVRGARALTKGK